MTIYLKDEATSKAVRKLAKLRGVTLTEAVHSAVAEALAKEGKVSREARVTKAIEVARMKLAKLPIVNQPHSVDKAFFDELSGDI